MPGCGEGTHGRMEAVPCAFLHEELILACFVWNPKYPHFRLVAVRVNLCFLVALCHKQTTCGQELSHVRCSQEAPRTRAEMGIFRACKSVILPGLRTSITSVPARAQTFQKALKKDATCLEWHVVDDVVVNSQSLESDEHDLKHI